jgi:hypothetical protein
VIVRRVATMVEVARETHRAWTIVLGVPGWPGRVAGQHVDVRLSAQDGYQTQRSYSIASGPEDERLALTVERIEDAEVSAYLTGGAARRRRARAARPDRRTVHLAHHRCQVAAAPRRGQRAGAADGDAAPPRRRREHDRRAPAGLTRSPDDVLYRAELAALAAADGLMVNHTFTRQPPSRRASR